MILLRGRPNDQLQADNMSLLADLFSKNNSEPSGGVSDVSPTLIRAHNRPPEVRNFKRRYVVVSLISVAIIAGGILALCQFGLLPSFSTKKPQQVAQPVKPPVVVAPITAVPVAVAPLESPPIIAVAQPAPSTPPTSTGLTDHNKAASKKHLRNKSTVKPRPTINKLAAILPAKRSTTQKQPTAKLSEAEAVATVAIDKAKRDSLLYAARAAEQVGNWNLALANYRKAQKIDPDNYRIMSNSSAALNNLGMFDEGRKEAKLALGKNPDYVPAMINAAIAYSSTGNSQEALDLFSKASSADPSNKNVAINLGILQERSGKLEDAQKTYRHLAEDGEPLALDGMGRIHERAGNKSEAARVYRQILAQPNANATLKKEVRRKLTRLGE